MVKQIFWFLGLFCVYTMGLMGYAGIAVLMGIESACIPLPSELIMPYAGAMSDPTVGAAIAAQYQLESLPQFNVWLAGLAGAIGCNLGSEIAYWVGATGGRRAIEKYGRYLLVSQHEMELADRLFARRGDIIILVARLLPVIRTFIAFPAGVARMSRVKFHVYTFVGSVPWCVSLAYVGQWLGKNLMSEDSALKHFMHKFDAVIAVVILAAAVWFVRSRLKVLRSYREGNAHSTAKE